MQSRKDRTVERYMRAGAAMRLFKTVYGEVITTLSKVMPKQDVEKIVRAMDKVEQVCSDTEDRMFLEHPDLSNEYIDVFYGDVRNDTRTDVDRKVVKMAHEMTEQLFEGGGRK
ncbi:MAG: hypothetical protein LKE84_00220 [Lachnospiraceae bacterium]|nr:hypothetical protein [Lachnospiraceae bacterium]MCH4065161.1 hypothetical protein [Lachnospiraceae bacterium]